MVKVVECEHFRGWFDIGTSFKIEIVMLERFFFQVVGSASFFKVKMLFKLLPGMITSQHHQPLIYGSVDLLLGTEFLLNVTV